MCFLGSYCLTESRPLNEKICSSTANHSSMGTARAFSCNLFQSGHTLVILSTLSVVALPLKLIFFSFIEAIDRHDFATRGIPAEDDQYSRVFGNFTNDIQGTYNKLLYRP